MSSLRGGAAFIYNEVKSRGEIVIGIKIIKHFSVKSVSLCKYDLYNCFKYSLQAEHMFEMLQTVGVSSFDLNVHPSCCDN